MIACVDTSASLRVALGEVAAFTSLQDCEPLVVSEPIVVESCRTLDGLRLQGALSMQRSLEARELIAEWLEAVDVILISPKCSPARRSRSPRRSARSTRSIWHPRAWVDENGPSLVMPTHDAALALAARSFDIALIEP